MTSKTKKTVVAGAGVVALAAGAFVMLGNRSSIPLLEDVLSSPPTCPLTGREARDEALVERPAVAIKIENNPAAYPLSGLETAEVVYEEPVEGGLTRFVAIYHCTDAEHAGPVRSARIVDPAIVKPFTSIVGAAGGNDIVRRALEESHVVLIDETDAGDAMTRRDRPGYTAEHTLYANSRAIRKLGRERYDESPTEGIFRFGELEGDAKRARSITIDFGMSTAGYEWSRGRWRRTDGGEPLVNEAGEQIAADNVIIEEHTVDFSQELVDVSGARSPEIVDVTGSGRAVLFRDGRAIRGRWVRESVEEPVRFETKAGEDMVLATGTTWVELVPDDEGDVKGSFSFER